LRWRCILASGIVFAIDENRNSAILEGFHVGRIAYLLLGSLLQPVLAMNHVEALVPFFLEILQGPGK
jgi:hypothetical protein